MRDEAVIALILVLVIASAGAGFFVGNSNRQTTTSTWTITTTSTVATTTTSFITINPGGPPPYANPIYLGANAGPGYSCGPGPCFGGNITMGYVFNCATEAATPAGCTTTVVTAYDPVWNYNMTIWYPAANDTNPLTNCRLLPAPDYPNTLQAWCQAVGWNSFVIASQPPEIA